MVPEDFLQRHAFLGHGVGSQRKPAEPIRSKVFNDAEVGDAEVSHVPQDEIAGRDMIEQVDTYGLVLFGAEVELVVDDFSAQQVEGEVHLASGGGSAGVAMTGEGDAIGFWKTDEGRVLDEDAPEGTGWGGSGLPVFPPAYVNQAEDEEGFDAAFGAVDALVECLRADVEMRGLMSYGDDELVDGGPPGGNGVEKGKQEFLW